ncbi:MAG TPA: GlcNAc-PI de-N-acetylase [Gammaproteobacteria bacterium]|jgi:LmbE family N-acetylglucosaminyl deacetylase|nr:GlcNAc-PI de-N-acetylase [Gammaproteobacteria bacterium]
MTESVLIVAAHADDEALGVGGTLARHAAAGDSLACVLMTDGVGARGDDRDAEITRRQHARDDAAKILGIQQFEQHNFPDNQLDSVPLLQLVQAVEAVIATHQPTVVYTHYAHDLNIDHRRTFQATLTACRPQAGHPVRAIYSFEVPSATEWAGDHLGPGFIPDTLVDISETFAHKRKALAAYHEEMRAAPHPRSIESITALATVRGHSVGVRYAEGLKTVRVLR